MTVSQHVTTETIKWVCLKTSYMLLRRYWKRSDFQPKCDWQTLKTGVIFTLRIYCSPFADPLAYLCSCINEAFNLACLQQNRWNSHTVQQELFFENMKLMKVSELSQNVCSHAQLETYGQLDKIFLLKHHLLFLQVQSKDLLSRVTEKTGSG